MGFFMYDDIRHGSSVQSLNTEFGVWRFDTTLFRYGRLITGFPSAEKIEFYCLYSENIYWSGIYA